jgi:hypothetical protein
MRSAIAITASGDGADVAPFRFVALARRGVLFRGRPMSCRHPIICALLVLTACGSKADVARAKRSLYDADFAVVFSAALEATRDVYPNVSDFPGTGTIKTAWHQVSYANNQDDLSNAGSISAMPANQQAGAGGMPTRLAYKRYFVRFDVNVGGGRPWRIKIVGHASEWEPGAAMPSELTGAARPHWLDGRTDALTHAIFKRVKKFAVPMSEEVAVEPGDEVARTDPKTFAKVPPKAATRLAALRDAVVRRELETLRAALFDDVVWSLGGAPGADTALAMWQADPEALDTMAKLLGETCGGDDKKVMCPAGAVATGQWQLVLEHRGEAWKVASYVKAE